MINDLYNSSQLQQGISNCIHSLLLNFTGLSVRLHSNEPVLLAELASYYHSYQPNTQLNDTVLELYALEQAPLAEQFEWLPVPREPGKTGRKEGYIDVASGRWIKKFKTGMSFLQRTEQPLAVGPCRANLAQVINFINNQFMNHYLRLGYTLGHAAAYGKNGQVTAIASGSGGGKSTLMLRCLEDASRHFVTNDRILLAAKEQSVHAIGVAKLPRVNPGTLLHSPRLRDILPAKRQAELLTMPTDELRCLEEKYDVDVSAHYGLERIDYAGPLAKLIMLDWGHNSDQTTRLEPCDLRQNPAEIDGLRKRPGPFFHDAAGKFADLDALASLDHYAALLGNVSVYRLTGKVDFDAAYQLINQLEQ